MIYSTFQEYRQAWDHAYTNDPPIPLNVDIELASVCNLECPFCFISDKSFDKQIRQIASDGKSKRRLMNTDLALKIIDQAASIGVPALKFNWRGESTIHHDYSKILCYAVSSKRLIEKLCQYKYCSGFTEVYDFCLDHDNYENSFLEILVNTNANCKDHAIDGLMAATKVMVSLDSCEPKTYKKMRVGGSLERAIEVTRELLHRNHKNVWARRVITKENKEEPFFEQCKEIFGENIKVSEHACFDRNQADQWQVECKDDLLERQYCGYPSQRIIVASTGLCYPCCVDLHETMPVGDINKQSLEEIWNGRPMQQLRKDLKKNIFMSKSCQKCESWMAYKHKNREFVKDREGVKIE